MSEESRINTLLETGQITEYDAALMRGERPTNTVKAQEQGANALRASGVRFSARPRGRLRDADSSQDPYWNVDIEPLTSEQVEINRRGMELVRATSEYADLLRSQGVSGEDLNKKLEEFTESYWSETPAPVQDDAVIEDDGRLF